MPGTPVRPAHLTTSIVVLVVVSGVTGWLAFRYKSHSSDMPRTFQDVGLTVRTEGIDSLGLTIEVPYGRPDNLGDYVIRNNGPHTIGGFRVIFETHKKRSDSAGQDGEILNRVSAQIPAWVYDDSPAPWTKAEYRRIERGAIPPGTALYCGLGRMPRIVTEDTPPPEHPVNENFPDYEDYEEIIIRLDAVILVEGGKIHGPNRNILTRNGTYATYEKTIANHVAARVQAQTASPANTDESGKRN